MEYYEIEFDNHYSICIKALREPTIAEATKFCAKDMLMFGLKEVISVDAISHKEACLFYDMEGEDTFPVFGQ